MERSAAYRYLLFEWARSHTATAGSRFKMHEAWSGDAIPRKAGRVSAWDVLAISRHAASTPIEKRAALRILSIVSPIVVRKGPIIAALLPQHLLEGPREITMPCQKVACAMYVV